MPYRRTMDAAPERASRWATSVVHMRPRAARRRKLWVSLFWVTAGHAAALLFDYGISRNRDPIKALHGFGIGAAVIGTFFVVFLLLGLLAYTGAREFALGTDEIRCKVRRGFRRAKFTIALTEVLDARQAWHIREVEGNTIREEFLRVVTAEQNYLVPWEFDEDCESVADLIRTRAYEAASDANAARQVRVPTLPRMPAGQPDASVTEQVTGDGHEAERRRSTHGEGQF